MEKKIIKKSIKKLEAIDGERSDTISYYLGASYYYENDYSNAIIQLQSISKSQSEFNDQAEWFLILSYLKSNQKSEALMMLKKIIAVPNHKFYNKAKDLINNLEGK